MRMHAVLVTVVAVGLIGIAKADKAEDAVKEEMKKLEGTWTAFEEEKDGTKFFSGVQPILTIKPDGTYQCRGGGQYHQGQYKCDPSQTPHHLDLIPDDSKQKPIQCIYQQEDQKQLQICFSPPGKERPKQFSTQKGSGLYCITYQKK